MLNQPLQNRLCACSKTGFVPSLNLLHQNRLCAYAEPTTPKPALWLLQNQLCACSKTGFVLSLNLLQQNRFCVYAKPTAPKLALCQLQNWLCACSKTGFLPSLNLPHQDRLCADPKPAFSFWINILTVSEVMCDCQGLGLVARIKASNLVFDIMKVLYWPDWDKSSFVASIEDAKPVLIQNRFCIKTGFVA